MRSLKVTGFTLIELMVVVAIVALLASIAYPSYQDHVRKSRRGDAKAVLLENAQFLERNYTMTGTFNTKPGGGALTASDLPFQQAPREGTSFYTIGFSVGPNASSYTLQADANAEQEKDGCGDLTLDHAGNKTSASGNIASCWAR